MTDDTYNPQDPAFLASRSLDEVLSDADAERLQAWLQASPQAERMFEEWRTVDAAVKQRCGDVVEVDETAFVESVLGRIAEQHDHTDEALDAALRTWRDDRVELDDAAYVDKVRSRLGARDNRTAYRPFLHSIRRPLAAAAVVALILTGGWWLAFSSRPVVEVSFERMAAHTNTSIRETAHARTDRVVIFDRTTPTPTARPPSEPGVAFAVIGIDDPGEAFNAPPL